MLTEGRYRKPRTVEGRGVSFSMLRDGKGNESAFWTATIMAAGVVRVARFSCGKYGFEGAKKAAHERRAAWFKDLCGDKISG